MPHPASSTPPAKNAKMDAICRVVRVFAFGYTGGAESLESRTGRPAVLKDAAGRFYLHDRDTNMPTLAPEATAAECEKQFQNGGPKLYFVDCLGLVRPCHYHSAKAARAWLDADKWVAARRKVGKVYQWVNAGKGTHQ